MKTIWTKKVIIIFILLIILWTSSMLTTMFGLMIMIGEIKIPEPARSFEIGINVFITGLATSVAIMLKTFDYEYWENLSNSQNKE